MSTAIVEKTRYTVEPLYQWDKNQVLEIRGLSLAAAPEIHFSNETMERAIVRQSAMDSAGVITVDVPNSLLQKPYKINVHICTYSGSTFETLYKIIVPVTARKQPSDYTITDDEEVYSFNALEYQLAQALTAFEETEKVSAAAKNTAENAATTAESAKKTASNAATLASTAVTTATDAATAASNAVATANDAKVLASEAAKTATFTASVSTSWTADSENGGYTQTIIVEDILETDKPIADVVLGTDIDANALYLEAWGLITRITTAADSITLWANGDAPETAFTIQMLVVR